MDPVYLESADGFRRCPYNEQHSIASVRFIGHLLKCSKSSGKKHRVCPWNAQHHIVEPSDYDVHMNTCINRSYVDIPTRFDCDGLAANVDECIENGVSDDSGNGDEPSQSRISMRDATSPKVTDVNHSNGTVPTKQYLTKDKVGIYGSLDRVEMGINSIVDAFAASSFSTSANGLAILHKLVDTIYEEAEKM